MVPAMVKGDKPVLRGVDLRLTQSYELQDHDHRPASNLREPQRSKH